MFGVDGAEHGKNVKGSLQPMVLFCKGMYHQLFDKSEVKEDKYGSIEDFWDQMV